jgi:hypothetical protein
MRASRVGIGRVTLAAIRSSASRCAPTIDHVRELDRDLRDDSAEWREWLVGPVARALVELELALDPGAELVEHDPEREHVGAERRLRADDQLRGEVAWCPEHGAGAGQHRRPIAIDRGCRRR